MVLVVSSRKRGSDLKFLQEDCDDQIQQRELRRMKTRIRMRKAVIYLASIS